MNEYWLSLGRLMAVIALAFVVEIRALSRYWRHIADWTIPVVGIASALCLAAAAFIIYESVLAGLPGADPALWLVPWAKLTLELMLLALVLPSALTVLVPAFAQPVARAVVWLVPTSRAMRRTGRSLRDSERRADRQRREWARLRT